MIAQHAALHPRDYTDPALFMLERERLFATTWQFVGFQDELATDGDYLTREIAGQPVLIRNMGGELRAFRNVCSHRFARLAAGEAGTTSGGPIRCPYHGWAYDRDGVPLGIPGNKECFDLSREEKQGLALQRFALERIGRFLFVRIAEDGPSLPAWAGPLAPMLQQLSDDFDAPFTQVARGWEADWKVGIENVLEVYHVDAVHPDSFRTVVDGSWRVEPHGPHSIGHAGVRPEALRWWEGAGKRLGLIPSPGFDHYVHLHLFPNLAIGVTAGRLISVQTYEPSAPGRFTLRYRLCLARADGKVSTAARAAVQAHLAGLNETLLGEDQAICAAVQAGTAHAHGRALLGANELRIAHFQDTLLRARGEHQA